MKKILGIDIGVTSVGWGIITEENKIVDQGVRLFDEVESKYKNSDRRDKRGSRRLIRRRKQRIYDMKSLLIANNIIKEDFNSSINPYEARLKGLTTKLSNDELASALLFYAKRRGSSLEVVDEDVKGSEQSTKVLLSENEKRLQVDKYIVVSQLRALKEEGKIRDHSNVYKTEDYIKELTKILSNQNLPEELNKKIIELVQRRRHFSEGPGNKFSPTNYGRYREITGEERDLILTEIKENYSHKYKHMKFEINFNNKTYNVLKNGQIVNALPLNLIELMTGKCSLFPDELRAPKQSFSAELFNFLNDLNNLKINNRENVKITKEEKLELIEEIRTKGNITIPRLLKYLKATEIEVTGFRVNKNEKPIITEFVGYKKLLKVYNELNLKIAEDKILDEIMVILTKTQVEEERFEEINKLVNNEKLARELSLITKVSQYHSNSLKAIYLLNKEMIEESLNQQEIITKNNLRQDVKLEKLSFDETLILSPVAKRAHREAIKLIEQLIKEHGDFKTIVIETTRSKNTSEERKAINDAQRQNELNRKQAENIIGDYGAENINRANILKVLLYKEQDGKCAYTGLPIDIGLLIRDSKAYEIDHIIPLSISYDDSRNNKVLVLPSANQRKGNKTPFGYFSSGQVLNNAIIKNWDTFTESVNRNENYSRFKKQNLLFMKDITKYEVLAEFTNRNIIDTSYAARSLMTTLKNYFTYNQIPTVVRTIRGKQTNLFRRFGIQEYRKLYPNKEYNPLIKDRNNYIHHAQDALIIAGLSNKKTINQLYNISSFVDDSFIDDRTGEVNPELKDKEIIRFLLDIAHLEEKDIKYSWKIDTKPNRQISDETIYSTRIINDVHRVVKKYNDIYSIESSKLKGIFSEKNKVNLLVYQHDIKTFEIILKAYEQYEHEKYPLQAFKENHGPIRKYSRKGNGPIVNSLNYLEDNLGNHIDITPKEAINKKVVKLQISPYRTDLYYNEKTERYKFVTIRYSNIEYLNNKFSINETWYNNELMIKGIDNDYKFIFSLYRNSIIKMSRIYKKEVETSFYKFIGTNNDRKNIIEVKPITYYEEKRIMPSIGQSTLKIEKYNVSITGKISKVNKEDLKLII